ncbi:MAG: hypothetical protein O7H39_17090 [Gammaproteobacteria bacterium]|nr:hypothetical protein [Gammaproteobacteria bacterium]
MKFIGRIIKLAIAMGVLLPLSGCDDPQVYGSIGVSSGYSAYPYNRYGYGGSRMHGSIAVGGRIY